MMMAKVVVSARPLWSLLALLIATTVTTAAPDLRGTTSDRQQHDDDHDDGNSDARSTNNNKGGAEQGIMAACLHVMDDNHRLPEWVAYHYHVLPLRRLIVSVDPRSAMQPDSALEPWRDLVDVEVWQESDYFPAEEKAALSLTTKSSSSAGLTALHRARQRKFNVECMKRLRSQGVEWVLMTDSDEFTMINPLYREQENLNPANLDIPTTATEGGVLKMLQSLSSLQTSPSSTSSAITTTTTDTTSTAAYGYTSACLPIHRRQFGGRESGLLEVSKGFPASLASALSLSSPITVTKNNNNNNNLQPSDLETLRWRHWGHDAITAHNGTLPGKTLIHLSAISDSQLHLFSGDPHRPVDGICDPRKVWSLRNETILIADHYLGSQQAFLQRDDSRLVDRILTYEQRKSVSGHVSDDARHWLSGFVNSVGADGAAQLLQGAGQLDSKANANDAATTSSAPLHTPKCAIAFFGLPRSFANLALPSIVKNVLLTNAEYGCDLFIHYYDRTHEDEGRFNRGGPIRAADVERLHGIFELVASRVGLPAPTIVLQKESEESFGAKHRSALNRYLTSKDAQTGQLKYFPYVDPSYHSGTQIENIVKQWYSIDSAWNLMDAAAETNGVPYDRVAMLRLDAFYTTPIDIYKVNDVVEDRHNQFAVVPGFGKFPVSDRMMIGPYHAVKIWATERFSRLEKHVELYRSTGQGMHPERFLAHSIFPAIEALGVPIRENPDVCFYRTRASDALILSDCDTYGQDHGIDTIMQQDQIEQVIHVDCLQYILDDQFIELRCDEESGKIETQRRFLSGEEARQRYLQSRPPLPPPAKPESCDSDMTRVLDLFGQVPGSGRRATEREGRSIVEGIERHLQSQPPLPPPLPPPDRGGDSSDSDLLRFLEIFFQTPDGRRVMEQEGRSIVVGRERHLQSQPPLPPPLPPPDRGGDSSDSDLLRFLEIFFQTPDGRRVMEQEGRKIVKGRERHLQTLPPSEPPTSLPTTSPSQPPTLPPTSLPTTTPTFAPTSEPGLLESCTLTDVIDFFQILFPPGDPTDTPDDPDNDEDEDGDNNNEDDGDKKGMDKRRTRRLPKQVPHGRLKQAENSRSKQIKGPRGQMRRAY